ncbi:MAG: DNA-binding protein YbaB, partial [Limisphaerales bacterium]
MDFGALFTDMQDKMKKVKEDLELSRIDGESGSGKVRVVVS